MKRTLSVILALVLLFAAIPLTADAAESDTASTGVVKIKHYDIWVGSTEVTSENKDDILGGKTAVYDPETRTLTLNDPVIRSYYHTGGLVDYSMLINTGTDPVTIAGRYHFTTGETPDFGVYGSDITFDGDFAIYGIIHAVYGFKIAIDGEYFYSNSIEAYDSLLLKNPLQIYRPENGRIIEGRVYHSDGVTEAEVVEFAAPSEMCTISYDRNGGSGTMESLTLKQGSEYYLRFCSFFAPDGAVFKGWSFDGSLRQPGEQVIVNDDCTLVAIWWTPCTVSFDPNEGSGSMEPVTLEKGSSYTLPECTFTPPSGKVFDSWRVSGIFATQAPGNSITVSENTTVKAVWKNASSGTYSISGSVTSFLSETDQITITPSKKSGDNFVAGVPQTVTGNSASYIFNDISRMSQYKLTVSKKNHIDREYTVTVLLGSKTCDLKICPIGDVNGDRKITNFDYSKVNQHVCKVAG